MSFPQIPTTVWWGVRQILNKTPSTTLDEQALAVQLGVQKVAAKQYISELINVGILTEDYKATPLANKWRLDSSYKDASRELNERVYPQSLRDTAPQSEGDRQKAISWFQHAGLGEGAAKNKASTYFLLGAENPGEAPTRTTGFRTSDGASVLPKKTNPRGKNSQVPEERSHVPSIQSGSDKGPGRNIPLNVNVQIHISADAASEQIEAIFSAMRRYLYDKQAS